MRFIWNWLVVLFRHLRFVECFVYIYFSKVILTRHCVVISIYIYIYIRNSRYAIISKSLVEEWTIEVEKIVDKKISRDKLERVVTTGSMKSFVKYCRFLIARHWRIARNVWKLLDEFERASFLYVRKTRVSSLHRLINFKKLIANVRQYLYQQISLLREITR